MSPISLAQWVCKKSKIAAFRTKSNLMRFKSCHFIQKKTMVWCGWCGLWASPIIVPNLFENDAGENVIVNGDRYSTMKSDYLMPKIEARDLPDIWFQQDGAAHQSMDLLREHFDLHIAQLCIHQTLNESQQRLLTALNTLKFDRPYMILAYQERLMSTVVQHFIDAGFKREDFKPHGVAWHNIEKEQAFEFTADPPEGFTLRHLTVKHAELVDSLWPHREPGSVGFVELLTTYNESVGIFDGAGNLVAWCLILPMGALGLLQVLDTHKRLGLGNLAVRYMSKLIAAKGLEVSAPVVFQNVASRSLFAKLGFKPIGNAYFVVVPTKHS